MSKRTWTLIGMIVVALLGGYGLYIYTRGGSGLPPPSGGPTFSGESAGLKQTRIVATLDAPIDEGKSAIWCASFQSAWKALQGDVAGEPVSLEGAGGAVDALNRAQDPRPDAPEGCLYAAAGWNDKGIVEQIRRDLGKQFPDKEPPAFGGIAKGSFVAYAYLEANVRFAVPYFQSREPMQFTCADGARANVSSFGIRPEDDYAYFALRRQPAVLYETRKEGYELAECIVDLDGDSTPSQILLARVERKGTLADTLAYVEEKIASRGREKDRKGLGPNDVLLVPDLFWRIAHRFAELEGRPFGNAALKGQRMDVAQQDIQFRLDRSGAELRAESKMYCLPIPTYYVFDRPFLICMRKRGAVRPYFVMWVDNAELLRGM